MRKPDFIRFEAGRNCRQKAEASRLAFLIDAAAYFSAFKSAALNARRSIFIIGWDIHSRTVLEFPDEARGDVPNELGEFLNYVASRPGGPEIRVLVWDSPRVYDMEREWLPQASFDWLAHPRMCFALDSAHPIGGSHHQKVVVIDDTVAFVGGLDLALERLDDPSHAPGDPKRMSAHGRLYSPSHDVQVMMEGEVAAVLGDVARDRWCFATGQRLKRGTGGHSAWPDEVAANLEDVAVAVAQTLPAWKGRKEIREVEALLLDTIAAAQDWVYIENQYFSCEKIAGAIARRLQEPEGPEFVVVVPRDTAGWLEHLSMGLRRSQFLKWLADNDTHHRFRMYAPVVGDAGDVALKVHSKLMIVDGIHLHVGSANLNNRSMGLDSECDVALTVDDDTGRAALIGLRNRLLAEHLGIEQEALAQRIEAEPSLIGAVESLCGEGRSLIPIEPEPLDDATSLIAEADLLDPDATPEPERLAGEIAADENGRKAVLPGIIRVVAVVALLLGLAALWRWGPLAKFADAETLASWGESLSGSAMGIAGVIAVYVLGSLVMVPVTALIAATGLLFGPFAGVAVAAAGCILGALAGYGAGRLLGRRLLRRIAGGWIDRLNRGLSRRGIASMTVVRLLPVAPFTVINMAAGASRIRLLDYVVGTVLGMAPGVLALTAFAGQVGVFLRSPDFTNLVILGVLALAIILAVFWGWRRYLYRRVERPTAAG